MLALHGATLHLVHVEEGATSRLFGPLASDAEVHAGEEYFHGIVDSLATTEDRGGADGGAWAEPKDAIVSWRASFARI